MEETGCPLPELCKATIQQLYPFYILDPNYFGYVGRQTPPSFTQEHFARHACRGRIFPSTIRHGRISRSEMPAILSSICSIIIIIAWSRWTEKSDTIPTKHSPRQIYQAWSVYGLIIFFILLAIPFNFRATSLLLFAGAFYRGRIQGVTTSRQFTLLGQTLVQIRSTIIMVIALVGISALIGNIRYGAITGRHTHVHLREVLRFLVPSSRGNRNIYHG